LQAEGRALLPGQVRVAATQELHMAMMAFCIGRRLGERWVMQENSSLQRLLRARAWVQVKDCCRARRGVAVGGGGRRAGRIQEDTCQQQPCRRRLQVAELLQIDMLVAWSCRQ
jgi:hypothetical protein